MIDGAQAELDDILSIESGSLADSLKLDPSYSSDLSIKQEPLSAVSDAEIHAQAKDRQKKDNHNMSESERGHKKTQNTNAKVITLIKCVTIYSVKTCCNN